MTEASRQDPTSFEIKVHAFFEEMFLHQKRGVSFRGRHAAPQLRHKQTDVVVHPELGPYVSCGSHISVMPGQQPGYQRVVQVHDRRQSIEWRFGQRALRPGSRGGRGFAGHAGDEFHEQLRQLEVMDGIENCERAYSRLRRIVATAGQHGCDWS